MAKITSFQQLDVWKRACQLVLAVYRMTKKFPAEERYGLVLSRDLGYVEEVEKLMADAEIVSRMRYRLIESVDGRG